MDYKRILTVQDISCVGQCSLTVALPILSASGAETCILPSAVLSTHTAGFKGFTCRDLTEDIPAIAAHWKKEGIDFDAVYTGYLASEQQILLVKELFSLGAKGCKRIVDPAMADGGKLYPAFDEKFAATMATLVGEADYALPNVTEACFLTHTPYRETLTKDYVKELVDKLHALGVHTVVLTGIGYREDTTGVVVDGDAGFYHYEHRRIPRNSHGTGDVYASAFTGALMRGFSAEEAAKIAADFTVLCIENTPASHWYGVEFEPLLKDYIQMLQPS